MGLKKLSSVVEVFKQAGKELLPTAVISKGSLPEGSLLTGTVGDIEELVKKTKPMMPAIIVLGETVGVHPEFYLQAENLRTELLGKHE